jgi:uncharacterized membrane protein YoaK (UPF0700 family)
MTPEWSARSYPTVPVVLGFAAGYVDGCTFVTLFGLFVAQVTGSFVTAGASLAGLLLTLLIVPNLNYPDQATALAAGLFRLSAVGVQSAFVRLPMRDTPSTNVMTTNTTHVAIDATEILLTRLGTSRPVGS